MIPAPPSLTPIDPAIQQKAFDCLRAAHGNEHRAIAALKRSDVYGAKMELQRQIQVLVTVLAMLYCRTPLRQSQGMIGLLWFQNPLLRSLVSASASSKDCSWSGQGFRYFR